MRHDEDSLQVACVRWFSLQYPRMAVLLHHSPNGGKRNASEAARFKAMGVRAGFPDLVLLVPRGRYHGLMIELKTTKGRQSEHQAHYQQAVEEQGYRYEICRDANQFVDIVTDYMTLLNFEQ